MPSRLPLLTAISPYHLVTREVPAMAALVLGTRSLTLLPYPAAGSSREDVGRAVRESPRYLRLLESWRWSSPLWRGGVIAAAAGRDAVQAALPAMYEEIRNDPSLAELRPLTRAAEALADEQPAAFLDSVSSDLLRGGPDPGISIPVNAALERFARQHGWVMVRGEAASVAQRAEARLGVRVFSIGLPVLVQAGPHRLLLLRSDLAPALRALRESIVRSLNRGEPCESLPAAVGAYARAFAEWSEAGVGSGGAMGRGDDDTGRRVVSGFVAVTGMHLPPDAVLQSSRAAVRSVGGYHAVSRARGRAPKAEEGVADGLPRQPTLVIRALNVAPSAIG